MSALLVAVALSTGSLVAAPPADEEAWITIDRDVLVAFETGAAPGHDTLVALEDPLGVRPEVVVAPLSEQRIDELSEFIHRHYRRCGGFVRHLSREEAYEAATRAARIENLELAPAPLPYTIDNGPVANALAGAVLESNIRATITTLSNSFFTRRHSCQSGQDSAMWIHALWTGYAAGRPDVTVELFNHNYNNNPPTLQPSVILTIQGTTTPAEVVVLGGHQDSTAGSNCSTSRAPGADDDASGIAVLSEIIRVAMAFDYQPQKTVKFMAYAAEESGLLGSNQIAQAYANQGVNVIGALQFDMTNYAGTPGADVVMFTEFTSPTQNAFVSQLADAYIPYMSIAKPRVTSQCGYGCSDHAAWHNRGFHASFPFESRFNDSNPFIHTQSDTLANSGNDARHSVPFANLGAAYMAELAKGGFTARPERAAPQPAKRRLRAAARQGRRS